MPVTTRPAALEDVNAILAVEQQAATAGHFAAEQYEQRVAGGFVHVAESDGALCGFLCARDVAREWEIENVVVPPSSRRRGIGDRLLAEFVQHARKRKATAIWLEVRASNQAARQLYEKHGFKESGKRRAYYRNPEEDAELYSLVFLPE